MNVLWLTFIPSPYRLSFFEELAKQCQLTVLFERSTSPARKNCWDDFHFNGYNAVVLPGITVGGYDRFCPSVKKYITDPAYDIIVISNPTSPTGIYAASLLKQRKIPYIVESDGAFPSRAKGIKHALKRSVMQPAALCLSTATLHNEYYTENGVAEDRILRYPFSSVAAADILPTPLSREEKSALKATLGICEEKAVVTVGSFIHRKGFDILLQAAANLPENVGTYFIGGTPTDEYKKLIERLNLNNVHFIDFQLKKDLWRYFQAADVFTLPTREDIWGLVINEAMANALPVVTTERCIAGLELVKQGENGYIVPVDDADTLAERINAIILNDEQLDTMSQKCLDIIRHYTFETMAQRHIEIFREALEGNKQ